MQNKAEKKKKRKKNRWEKSLNKSHSIDTNLMNLILTLNVNDLSTPIKGERLTHWIKKQDLFILYEKSIFNTKK